MAVTASMVKQLREMTGAGMMDCKKALGETDGNMDDAIELLRKKGMAGADKKAGRTAAEGVVAIAISDDKKKAAIVEVNCETDFVAKGDEFKTFADEVAQIVLASGHVDVEAVLNEKMANGQTVDERRREMVGKIGENMAIRRAEIIETSGQIGQYQHGEKIGVVVAMDGGDDALIRDIAMHVAAAKPSAISVDDVDQEMVEKERKFQIEQAQESGKPAEIIEKMIEGRMRKYLQEITLLGQAFVKDPDQSVEKLLKASGASVNNFVRLEVGEGIEIEETNFADEVAAAAAAAKG
ncbi:MAG: elongation factor Ts [Piscirickettsiaceae bacterium CG_4_9_14_3_um_filter_43_564]|nr:elongation factor Ts [Thiomicrospira sp.]OIP94263.1 MAG: translation elongation factor Ts [Thiomicrospira sp. CG2_30_44_34]PIQ02778.1 MAG: elongation factor Ts [Piscirickettsiaceae bacterium CG18_big_fil_WC_8_21_14_2_50_44_103]PIU38592.1 MAG: elongation factor Ts [Piscirickettsiaceae bacterium CG07_land_8_20_14_0_80_44_28]PIW58449.1 MAG: elongation factor Ts [Piscirickettsiaceae bacterium CG12_big_fil_rev_8_21_14_0_65_44_934]PIW78737.1 MAG: elongation factor Ts [Piscirickettsiaceae bacteriu